MIIRGGFNVYPREIEETLVSHPDVSLAAVIGVPHDQYGEEIKAFVVMKDGATITERSQSLGQRKHGRLQISARNCISGHLADERDG